MKNLFIKLLAVFTIFSMTACSISPGVPGLKASSAKPQQEGVDYNLVVIDANTIRDQKPFDYVAYIKLKEKRLLSNGLRPAWDRSDVIESESSPYIARASGVKGYSEGDLNNFKNKEINRFEGITSIDNKANYQYKIGKGDVLNITVWDHPELTKPSDNNAYGGHVVSSDGDFYFPYSGKISALGKTVNSIRNELEGKLESFITKPQISISIARYRSQKTYVSGAVVKPVTIIIDDTPTTVRDAISESGGLKPNQYTGYATLSRSGKNIPIDLNRMLKYNDNRQNFILKNGDRLNIVERTELDEFNRELNLDVQKENTISSVKLRNDIERERTLARFKKELERDVKSKQAKVFVMGEVGNPGSVEYQLEDGMTLAEAINDAGSLKEESFNPKGVFLIRKVGNLDIPTVYQLPIASVQSMFFAEQFEVIPRDIVYVTATPSIRWNRVLSQLLPSLTVYSAIQ